jgi:hypothetical protein
MISSRAVSDDLSAPLDNVEMATVGDRLELVYGIRPYDR